MVLSKNDRVVQGNDGQILITIVIIERDQRLKSNRLDSKQTKILSLKGFRYSRSSKQISQPENIWRITTFHQGQNSKKKELRSCNMSPQKLTKYLPPNWLLCLLKKQKNRSRKTHGVGPLLLRLTFSYGSVRWIDGLITDIWDISQPP